MEKASWPAAAGGSLLLALSLGSAPAFAGAALRTDPGLGRVPAHGYALRAAAAPLSALGLQTFKLLSVPVFSLSAGVAAAPEIVERGAPAVLAPLAPAAAPVLPVPNAAEAAPALAPAPASLSGRLQEALASGLDLASAFDNSRAAPALKESSQAELDFALGAMPGFMGALEKLGRAKSQPENLDDPKTLAAFVQEAYGLYELEARKTAPSEEAALTALAVVSAFVRMVEAGAAVAANREELEDDLAVQHAKLTKELKRAVGSRSLEQVRSVMAELQAAAVRELSSPAAAAEDNDRVTERNLAGVYVLELFGGKASYRVRLRKDKTAYILRSPSEVTPPLRRQEWAYQDGLLSFYVDGMLASQIAVGDLTVGQLRAGVRSTYTLFSYPAGSHRYDCGLRRYDRPSDAGSSWY